MYAGEVGGEVGGGPAVVASQTCVSVSLVRIRDKCSSRCFLVSSGDTGVKFLGDRSQTPLVAFKQLKVKPGPSF